MKCHSSKHSGWSKLIRIDFSHITLCIQRCYCSTALISERSARGVRLREGSSGQRMTRQRWTSAGWQQPARNLARRRRGGGGGTQTRHGVARRPPVQSSKVGVARVGEREGEVACVCARAFLECDRAGFPWGLPPLPPQYGVLVVVTPCRWNVLGAGSHSKPDRCRVR